MVIINLKQQIRKKILLNCSKLTTEERADMEYQTLRNMFDLLDKATSIAVYHAYGVEFDLKQIIQLCLSRGKYLYQPVAYRHTKTMLLEEFCWDKSSVFSPAAYIPKHVIEWYNVDLILVPVVAVDFLGYRLGKGGGYYDTTLAKINRMSTCLCGIGYGSIQQVEVLPHENFDVRLDYFACENGLNKF